ncbi:MAG: NifU family protein [Bacilli bacterium]|nr:NifU family protein [Bacilli bacterium]
MEDKIKDLIEHMRPFINMDGGDIEFVKFEEGYVYIKMFGACQDCGLQDSTLNDGLLSYFKSEIPEIEGVINVNL